jgi:glycosyltransferase involved in cell wall biosynthesis
MWEEPFGLVAAEAQATGTPVVGYRRGGLTEIIVDGVTGFLVAADDVPGAAGALRAARRLSRRSCRRHAETDLDLEPVLLQHERLYQWRDGSQPNKSS